jgi:hypothetical protein
MKGNPFKAIWQTPHPKKGRLQKNNFYKKVQSCEKKEIFKTREVIENKIVISQEH